ncbi:DUF3251 domain-containing protein [Stenotrophomonas maltophilia]|uniref:DUF3251 domain-containing protein n=1 Tax=Stenotrophomonas maltophilia TaxID=40324 RepID=UPI0015624955|nr:DUF3251 domain-containing protein [Stenotrophomonas maltophilia]NRP03269.1 DUF3251 domain-containing protein [Stenotrophomonas maltophilia]
MKKIFLAVVCVLGAQGCQKSGADLSPGELAQIRGDLSYLKSSQQLQDNLHNALMFRVEALETSGATRTVFLDPAGGSGYQYLQTNVSPVVAAFVDAMPQGDGTRIRVRIGNLSSATYSGIELGVTYNKRPPSDGAGVEAWNKANRTITARNAGDLPAGAWTIVEASLPGIKPDDLGHIALKADFDTLRLRAPQ